MWGILKKKISRRFAPRNDKGKCCLERQFVTSPCIRLVKTHVRSLALVLQDFSSLCSLKWQGKCVPRNDKVKYALRNDNSSLITSQLHTILEVLEVSNCYLLRFEVKYKKIIWLSNYIYLLFWNINGELILCARSSSCSLLLLFYLCCWLRWPDG